MPEHYSFVNEEEAAIYANNSRQPWEQTPGALDWLQDRRRVTE